MPTQWGKCETKVSATFGGCALRLCSTLLLLLTTCAPTLVADAVPVTVLPRHSSRSSVLSGGHTRAVDHVVFIVIDGVRWQEVFFGVDPEFGDSRALARWSTPDRLMPELHRIARARGLLLGDEGSKVTVTSPATVSLPGYSELFGGRTPQCGNNDCPPTPRSTLLDDWHRVYPEDRLALVSSWEKIPLVAARDSSRLIVSAGRKRASNLDSLDGQDQLRRMLEAGRNAGPSPGFGDYRPDRYTVDIALGILAHEAPAFLFLGLGDTDEHAHQGNYRAYLDALHEADEAIGRVDAWLSERQGLGERTLLVVTTDHGRARSFRHHGGAKEAARIWTLWGGNVVHARGYPVGVDHRLADVAPTVAAFMGIVPTSYGRDGAGTDRAASLSELSEVASHLPSSRSTMRGTFLSVSDTRL